MPLYAVRPDERMALPVGPDACLYYRRLTLVEARSIDAAHTVNGVRDTDAALVSLCVKALVGWEGYACPITGDAIPFEPQHAEAHRAYVAALPVALQTEVATRCQAALAQRETDLKNSLASSSVSTP